MDFLKQWGPVKDLNYTRLSLRTCAILALATCKRPSDLTLLHIGIGQMTDNRVTNTIIFSPVFGAKNARAKHPYQPFVTLHQYDDCPELCPVRHIRQYIQTTSQPHRQPRSTALFVNRRMNLPATAATRQSIASWLKEILHLAGIYRKGQKWRATAASNAAIKGASIEQLLAAGDRSAMGVVQKHYLLHLSDETREKLMEQAHSVQALNLGQRQVQLRDVQSTHL